MNRFDKIVDFQKYCQTCKYKDTNEADVPCCICLTVPARPLSHKPIEWKEAETQNGYRIRISRASERKN